MTNAAPRTPRDYIEQVRTRFVCRRCGRYVGSLAPDTYLPPAYPIASGDAKADETDEVEALIQFEWHMAGLLGRGKFALAHPEREGRCISIEEWARDEVDDDE